MLQRFGVRHIVERDWWHTVTDARFTATCTRAQHFSARGLRDRNETLWCGLPIGAYEPRWFMRPVHMNPEDAVAAYRALVNGSTTPPCLAMHWGTFRLTDEPVDEPPQRFARCWLAAGLSGQTNWTLAHGETRRL